MLTRGHILQVYIDFINRLIQCYAYTKDLITENVNVKLYINPHGLNQ